MTELDKTRQLFTEMGVTFKEAVTEWDGRKHYAWGEEHPWNPLRADQYTLVRVSGTKFIFDSSGRFVATQDEEYHLLLQKRIDEEA